MKKSFLNIVIFCAWIMCLIMGVGVSLYNKNYSVAVCVAILAAMAFPYAKKLFKE